MSGDIATWTIAFLATAGVVLRPFRWPEAVWALSGALLLVVLGLLSWKAALVAAGRGTDVYLFLIGMMLLSEIARREALFDWLAAFAVRRSGGSGVKLFTMVYAVGIVTTAFLSNDATAVVLTPAVFAAARAAKVPDKLPYLLVCAFIANAASFLLPISNPANLVLYASRTPPLLEWLGRFLLPAVVSVIATFLVLGLMLRRQLRERFEDSVEQPSLSGSGRVAAVGIVLTAIVLLAASTLDVQLGLPTAIMGFATAGVVWLRKRESPWSTLRGISWLVLPLVAGLFVLVSGVQATGFIAALARALHDAATASSEATTWGAGIGLAVASNLMNNLPAGLIAAKSIAEANPPQQITDALLVGVDLGPNLSVTGSLATILWLTALRREGEQIGFFTFLRIGAVAMPAALIPALTVLLLT